MTKTQFILNIIFFIPLLLLNFFLHGIDGCVELCEVIKEYGANYEKLSKY